MAIQLCGSICHEAAGLGLLQLSVALEQWGRDREESRSRILPFSCFPLQKISPEITSASYPGNTGFKADKSNKT